MLQKLHLSSFYKGLDLGTGTLWEGRILPVEVVLRIRTHGAVVGTAHGCGCNLQAIDAQQVQKKGVKFEAPVPLPLDIVVCKGT